MVPAALRMLLPGALLVLLEGSCVSLQPGLKLADAGELAGVHHGCAALVAPRTCPGGGGPLLLALAIGVASGCFRPFLQEQVGPLKVRVIVTNGVSSLEKCTLDRRSEVVVKR